MPNDPAAVEFGGARFWQTAPVQFQRFYERAPRLQAALNEITGRAYPDCEPLQRFLLNLTMLAGVSLIEVITLVQSGLGMGAMKITRSIVEYAINAEFLRRFPNEFENYRMWNWVEQHQLLEYFRQFSPESLEKLSAEEKARVEIEFQNVRQRFEIGPADNRRLRPSWCAQSLAQRAFTCGFAVEHRTAYMVGSRVLHGSIGGVGAYFDVDVDPHRIAVPPSLDYCGHALISGHLCVLRTIETLANAMNTAPVPAIAELVADYRAIWGEPQGAAPKAAAQ